MKKNNENPDNLKEIKGQNKDKITLIENRDSRIYIHISVRL